MVGVIPTLHTKIMGLQWFINRLEALSNGKLIEFMQECLNENEEFLTTLNKKQLLDGTKADDTKFKPYTPTTIKLKKQKGLPAISTLISLHETGEFWSLFWAKAESGKLIMSSKDKKTDELISRYGESIFGLTKSNFEILGEKIMPLLRQKITTYLKA